MADVKIKLNREGVSRLLKSDEAADLCKSFAQSAANKLGDGYEVSTYKGKKRVNASIKAVSYKARKDTRENNAIIKAVCSK
ncbi:MAG: hypothetical protein IJ555_09350 [Ruminococcus sp.]|nr:hypothetical protein [Ruminococcus sp.]